MPIITNHMHVFEKHLPCHIRNNTYLSAFTNNSAAAILKLLASFSEVGLHYLLNIPISFLYKKLHCIVMCLIFTKMSLQYLNHFGLN